MAVCLLRLPEVCPSWCADHRVYVGSSGRVSVTHQATIRRPGDWSWSVSVDQRVFFSPEGRPIPLPPDSPGRRPQLWLQGGDGAVLASPVSAEELAGVLALAPVLAEGVAEALREAARVLGWEVV